MFLLTAPGPVKGIRYTPQSRSELTVAAPFKQDISVARGVITAFYCTVVDYSGDTVVQMDNSTTVDDDVYCVDEESLNDIAGEDLFKFTFSGLSEINLGLLLASLNYLNICFYIHVHVTDAEIPYNVTVYARNSAGNGLANLSFVFTEEGSKFTPMYM